MGPVARRDVTEAARCTAVLEKSSVDERGKIGARPGEVWPEAPIWESYGDAHSVELDDLAIRVVPGDVVEWIASIRRRIVRRRSIVRRGAVIWCPIVWRRAVVR